MFHPFFLPRFNPVSLPTLLLFQSLQSATVSWPQLAKRGIWREGEGDLDWIGGVTRSLWGQWGLILRSRYKERFVNRAFVHRANSHTVRFGNRAFVRRESLHTERFVNRAFVHRANSHTVVNRAFVRRESLHTGCQCSWEMFRSMPFVALRKTWTKQIEWHTTFMQVEFHVSLSRRNLKKLQSLRLVAWIMWEELLSQSSLE